MKLVDKFKLQIYNIGCIPKGIDKIMREGVQSGDIVWLAHDYKDRFFADPFMIDSDTTAYYILCEEFLFFEEKGKITLLEIDKSGFRLRSRKVIIEEPYHLSFPYCKYGGNTIIPESCEAGIAKRYSFDRERFEITSSEIILNEGAIDAVITPDGQDCLYATVHPNPLTKAFAYERDGLGGGYITPGAVIVEDDEAHARSAGDFFEWEGSLYRPVQDCRGRYGRQTIIMHVRELGLNYRAEEYRVINSFENPPFDETLHTFNVYEDCVIVDGSKDYLRFPDKFFYKKTPFLFASRLKEQNG